MAKRRSRVLRARKEGRDDDSLLIRSAESLGRVIGSLQRQVRRSSKAVIGMADDAMEAVPKPSRFDRRASDARTSKKTPRKSGSRKSTAARKASGSRKRGGTAAPGRKSARKR